MPVPGRHAGRERLHRCSLFHALATEIAGDMWAEERRPVPGKPDVPPDVWISFSVSAAASG